MTSWPGAHASSPHLLQLPISPRAPPLPLHHHRQPPIKTKSSSASNVLETSGPDFLQRRHACVPCLPTCMRVCVRACVRVPGQPCTLLPFGGYSLGNSGWASARRGGGGGGGGGNQNNMAAPVVAGVAAEHTLTVLTRAGAHPAATNQKATRIQKRRQMIFLFTHPLTSTPPPRK